jgi:hypothetical protein
MTLTPAQKQLGTLPTSRGDRYLAPGSLPAGPTGDRKLDVRLAEYHHYIDVMRKDEATVTRLTKQIEEAREHRAQLVYEARVKRQAEPKDPVPGLEKKLEAAQAALDVSEYTVVQTSNHLQDMRDDADLQARAQATWDEKLARIIGMTDSVADAMDDLGEALYLRTWLKSHNATKKVLGRAEVAALRRQLAKYQDVEPPRRVSPAAMKQLEAGEDVLDIDGKPLPFALAEDLHKRGKLRVNHGQLLPRNAPEMA